MDQDEKLVRSDEGVELMVELIGVGPKDTYRDVDGMEMVHARFNFLVHEFKKQGAPKGGCEGQQFKTTFF